MTLIATALTALVAVIHVYIAYVEIFAWKTRGPKFFNDFDADFFDATQIMATNQGVYNLFLAAGLFWAIIGEAPALAIFFLVCVAIAGVVGAITASRKLLIVQTAVAVAAILAVVM